MPRATGSRAQFLRRPHSRVSQILRVVRPGATDFLRISHAPRFALRGACRIFRSLLALALVAGLAGGVVDRRARGAGSRALRHRCVVDRRGARVSRTSWPRVYLAAPCVCASRPPGWLLGAHAIDRALHTPLRTMLEQRVGGFAIDAPDDGRLDEPLLIEGRLREDAALTESGCVAARRRASGVDRRRRAEPAAGGVSLGVGGARCSGDASPGWTAGRAIRAPALLRRPARYLNAGLRRSGAGAGAPRHRRSSARSRAPRWSRSCRAAPWWEEAAARDCARVRAARLRATSAPRDAAVGGDRHGDPDRRSRRPRRRHRAAAAGSRHVSRHRHLRRQHRDPRRPRCSVASRGVGVRGRVARAGHASPRWRPMPSIAAGGASVARATLMAVIYLAVRADRSADRGRQRDRRSRAAICCWSRRSSIADVGFWLTFGATRGDPRRRRRIVRRRSRRRLAARRLRRCSLAIDAAAELALAPIERARVSARDRSPAWC